MTDDCDLFGQEIKELLQNYKQKKTTVYEPCTVNNYIECLIGLREVNLFFISIKTSFGSIYCFNLYSCYRTNCFIYRNWDSLILITYLIHLWI